MGLVSLKNVCLILICILLTSYYISAFRLINTSPQQDAKKERQIVNQVTKEEVRIKDEIIPQKEKYKNQTIKLHIKSKSIESETMVKREPIISEKKTKTILPTLPLNITKEKILIRAKDMKSKISEETKLKVKVESVSKKEPVKQKEILRKEEEIDDIKVKEIVKTAKKIPVVKTKVEMKELEKPEEKPIVKKESVKIKQIVKPIKKEAEKTPPIKQKVEKQDEIEKPKDELIVKKEIVKPIKKEAEKTPAVKQKVEKQDELEKPKDEPLLKKETAIPVKKDVVKPKIEKKEIIVEKPPVKVEEKPEQIAQEPSIVDQQEKITILPPKPTKILPESSSNLLYYNLPSFAPNFDLLENEECKKHVRILTEQFHNRKIWAMKMFDATAKIPSGILKGNLNQFGDYDQCLGIFVKIPDDEKKDSEVKIAGKYCLANIDVEAEISDMKLPVHLAQGRALLRSKSQDPGHFIPRFTTIRWGLCIPSSCSADDAEKILEDSIKQYNDSSFIGLKFDVSVDADQCSVRKVHKKLLDYHYTTLLTVVLSASIVILVFIATLRDIRITELTTDESNKEISKSEPQESSTLEKMLMSFSLKQTTTALLKKESDPDEIECIHGIRTISTFILYIAHKLIPIGHLPFTNKTTLTEIANNPFSVILRLSIIYTDTFLLLSGILTSYRMSKDIEEKGHIPWFNRIVARFIRLTPSLLFVLLYYAYVMELLGDGPLWNTIVTPNASLCKDYWWRNILYIQNVYPFQDMCATHTHQLALDMQLSLIAPVLVWLLYRRPLMGVFMTLLLHSISVILRYYATMNYRLSLVIYHGISISQLYRTANMLYASSLHRATPYIAGVGLGVLLRQMKPNFCMPKVLAVIGWIVAGYFATWALYSPSHLSSRTYQYDINEAAQFSALCSLAWALALSWLIFACFADHEGYLNIFLSSRPMVLLSRISYTLYLTQFIVFFYNVGTVRSATEFKISTSIDLTEMLIVIIISTLLTLLVDMPVQKIKSILLRSISVVSSNSEEPDVTPAEYENHVRKLSTDSQKSKED